jgi:hypothetical protein
LPSVADAEDRIVVSKDSDFRDGHLLRSSPRRLLVIATGNIANSALLALIDQNLDAIVTAHAECDFVELGPDSLFVHPRSDGPLSDRRSLDSTGQGMVHAVGCRDRVRRVGAG